MMENRKMNYREKVDFLEGYSRSMAKIQAYQAEYERWETIGTKVTQTYSLTPGGGGSTDGKVAMAAMEMAKLSEQIGNEITAAVNNRDAIRKAISTGCSRKRYADILEYRYIAGLQNYKIAAILGKEPKTVSNILHKAIQDIDL